MRMINMRGLVCLIVLLAGQVLGEGWVWWDREYPVRGRFVFDGFIYERENFYAKVQIPEEYGALKDAWVVEYTQDGQVVGEERGWIGPDGYASFIIKGRTEPFQKRYFAIYLGEGEGLSGAEGCKKETARVENGGFEEWRAGFPAGWRVYGKGGEFKPVEGYNGGLALELESHGRAFGFESGEFIPVRGGAYYLLKVRIALKKAPEQVAAGATAEVLFYNGDKKFLGHSSTIPGDRSVGRHDWYLLLYGTVQ